MDALIAQIESTLNSNGGSMTYEALLETIPFQDRRNFPNALKMGKQLGKFKRKIAWNAEAKANDFTVEIMAPAPTPEPSEG